MQVVAEVEWIAPKTAKDTSDVVMNLFDNVSHKKIAEVLFAEMAGGDFADFVQMLVVKLNKRQKKGAQG